MSRFRHWISMLVAFVLAFLAGPARAQAMRETTNDGRPVPVVQEDDSAPATVAPRDVSLVIAPSQLRVPSLPDGYVTKDLGWLKFSFPQGAEERVAPLLRDAESVKAELAEALGQQVLERVELRIVQTTSDMARLAPVNAPPPAYADGVAYPRIGLVLISMLAPRGGNAVDLERVFRHELAHVALENAVQGRHVPTWFNEGLAVNLSGEHGVERMRALWHAATSGTVLPLSELDRHFPSDDSDVNIAYAQSADFLRFLTRQSDSMRFTATIRRIREGIPFERAMSDAYGTDLRTLEFQWRSELDKRFSLFPVLAGGGILWVAVIGALGYGWVKKRKRKQIILARWEREEAIEDAIRARLAQEAREREEAGSILGHAGHAALSFFAKKDKPAPKVEHDGRWHTLH